MLADAEANRSYFLAESMGRSAGWLAYGVAIAGEASLVVSVEDMSSVSISSTEETVDSRNRRRRRLARSWSMDEVIPRIVATMTTREREGKQYGVIRYR